MMDENGKNRFSIWNILLSSRDKDKQPKQYTAEEQRKIVTYWQIASFIGLFIVLLWLYESVMGLSAVLSGNQEGSYNPVSIFFHGLKDNPKVIIVLGLISFVASRLIANVRKASFDAPIIVTDEKGDKVVLNSSVGVRNILTEEEEGRIFDLTDIDKPTGVPIAINKNSNKLIVKQPGVRTDIEYHLANDNILVAGPSGAGKTSGILDGAAATHQQMHHGCLIFDPKGDLYPVHKPIDIGYGRKNFLLDFKDNELGHSDGWDCLKPIREADIDSAIQQADSFATIILENGAKEYWTDTIKNLFKLLLLFVTHCRSFIPADISTSTDDSRVGETSYDNKRTWRELMRLVTTSSEELKNIIESALTDPYDNALIGDYYTTWAEDKNYSQIRSSLANALDVFKTPAVIDILSSDEIDIDALADGDTTIYVACSGRKTTYIQVLTLFVNTVLDRTMAIAESNGGRLDHMLFVMLEEFNNLGRLDMLPKVLSQNRSYNIGILISIQTMNQLDKYNTPEEPSGRSSIESACALQLCVGANEGVGTDDHGDTATYFAARAGYKARIDEQVTEHRFKPVPESIQEPLQWNQSKRISTRKENVYPPDRIQMIKPTEIFISPGPHNCIMEKKYQWSLHPLYGTYATDRTTGERMRFLTTEHTPERKGGKPNTKQEYEIHFPKEKKRAPKKENILEEDSRTEEDFYSF